MARRTYTATQRRTAIAAARTMGAVAAAAAHGIPVGTLRSWLLDADRPALTFDPARLVDAAGGSLRTVAARLGIDPANLCRPLSEKQADRYATALGMHPSEVWR